MGDCHHQRPACGQKRGTGGHVQVPWPLLSALRPGSDRELACTRLGATRDVHVQTFCPGLFAQPAGLFGSLAGCMLARCHMHYVCAQRQLPTRMPAPAAHAGARENPRCAKTSAGARTKAKTHTWA